MTLFTLYISNISFKIYCRAKRKAWKGSPDFDLLIYIFIRLDGQQTAHNTQLEKTIKHNHTQLKER